MKKPGLMIALGVPKDGADGDDDIATQRVDCAKRIIKAVKGDDADGLLDALEHLELLGSSSSDDDEDDDDEEY